MTMTKDGIDSLTRLVSTKSVDTEEQASVRQQLAPRILWRVEERWFCVDAELVNRVLSRDHAITAAPGLPPWCVGLTLVREQLVPVVDVDAFLSGSEGWLRATSQRLVLLVPSNELAVALAADEARGVVYVPPPIQTDRDSTGARRVVRGTVDWEGKLITELDATKFAQACLRRSSK